MTQALYCFGLTLPADLRKKYMQIKAQHTKHRLLMPQQRSVHLLFFCALQIPSVLHVCESVFPSVSDAPADAQAVPAGTALRTVLSPDTAVLNCLLKLGQIILSFGSMASSSLPVYFSFSQSFHRHFKPQPHAMITKLVHLIR